MGGINNRFNVGSYRRLESCKDMEKVKETIIEITDKRYGNQLWCLARMRKDASCVSCGDLIEKGEEAFRPITNSGNRMYRRHNNRPCLGE